jgi:hypothetical protein
MTALDGDRIKADRVGRTPLPLGFVLLGFGLGAWIVVLAAGYALSTVKTAIFG